MTPPVVPIIRLCPICRCPLMLMSVETTGGTRWSVRCSYCNYEEKV